ncbi:MAG: deoxyribonuclease IV [Candidatus Nanopelagicales bacterium]|nr:deoxyribonuclease IV [Candidatus Nanopelagicales bacterium]
MLRVGGHVGLDDPIGQAQAIGANACQIFLGNPRSWSGEAMPDADWRRDLVRQAGDADIAIYVHAPYVINVASANNRIRIPSRKLLQTQIEAAASIGAAGLVVHGGHVTGADEPEIGYVNWHKALSQLELICPLLIENTAGGKKAMARTLDALGRLWDTVGEFGVGFCVDTCHAWAAGIGLPAGIEAIKAITGRIDLVHANDSDGDFGSGRDRHQNLGRGTIGAETVVESCALARAPVICETPAAGIAADIALIRDGLQRT